MKIKATHTYLNAGRRADQEDHALVMQEKKIFVVADGFGGPGPGAAASKTACESIQAFLYREAGDADATLPFVLRSYYSLAGNVLFNALVHANVKVKKMNLKKTVHERGGASVIAGFMDGDNLALANIGNCSAWLFRGEEMCELVTPRSYARMVDPTQKDSKDHLNIPLIALGFSEDLQPEIIEYQMHEGDWLVLQSDGVQTRVREAIRDLKKMAEGQDTDHSTELTKILGDFNYDDNATLVLLKF
jgi:PPM family protein phosphatase